MNVRIPGLTRLGQRGAHDAPGRQVGPGHVRPAFPPQAPRQYPDWGGGQGIPGTALLIRSTRLLHFSSSSGFMGLPSQYHTLLV